MSKKVKIVNAIKNGFKADRVCAGAERELL